MDKNKFIELVAEHILEYMPESYKDATVEVMERAKNNDTKLHGLIIRNKKTGALSDTGKDIPVSRAVCVQFL